MMVGTTGEVVTGDTKTVDDDYLDIGGSGRVVILDRRPTDKPPSSLGIQIGDTVPIQVVAVFDGGLAEKAGMKVGDKIMNINGDKFEAVSPDDLYDHVIALLQQEIEIKIEVEEGVVEGDFSDAVRTVEIDGSHGLGMSIVPQTTTDGKHFGMRISEITPEGAADMTGNIFAGDQVLSVNNTDITKTEHDAAIKVLQDALPIVTLVLELNTDESDEEEEEEEEEELPVLSDEDVVEPVVEPIVEPAIEPVVGPVQTVEEPEAVAVVPPTEEPTAAATTTTTGTTTPPTAGDQQQQRVSVIHRATPGGSLGLKIITQPDAQGVEIQEIVPGGAAARAGNIHVGDLILEINGQSVLEVDHEEVVNLLARGDVVTITVTPPDGAVRRRVTIEKENMSLGLQLVQNKGSPYHRVAGIAPGSASDHTGLVSLGDRIIEINGETVEGADHEHVMHLITQSDVVTMCLEADTSAIDDDVDDIVNCLDIKTIFIEKVEGSGFGMKLKSDSLTRGVKVASVTPASAAERAHVTVGDVILSINSTDTLDMTHNQVLEVLSAAQGVVVFQFQAAIAVEGATRTVVLKADAQQGLGLNLLFSSECAYPRISNMVAGGVAETSKQLYAGDRIISCNTISCNTVTHDYCMALLGKSPEVSLLVEHDETPMSLTPTAVESSLRQLIMERRDGEHLGFEVSTLASVKGLVITSVIANSVAEASGCVPGEVVVAVNNKPTSGKSHDELVHMLRTAGATVIVTVAKISQARQVVLTKGSGSKGFGIHISHDVEGPARVLAVLPGTTADAARLTGCLNIGDNIIGVNGTDVHHASFDHIQTILTSNEEELTLTLEACTRPLRQIGDTSLLRSAAFNVVLTKTSPTDILGIRFHTDAEIQGHVVTDVVAGSLAADARTITPGNILLSLNGEDMTTLSHKQVVDKLRAASTLAFEFGDIRNVPRVHTMTASRHPEGFGFGIASTNHMGDGRGIRIINVLPGSNAHSVGVQAGMRLVMANDHVLLTATHDQALAAICSGHEDSSTFVLLECDRPIPQADATNGTVAISVKTITLCRLSNEALGLAIISDQFGLGARVQFVKKGGLADQSQKIVVGDKILSINGVNVESTPRAKILLLLATNTVIKLVLKPDTTPLPADSGSLAIPRLTQYKPHTITLTRVMTPNTVGLGIELYSHNKQQSGGYIGEIDPTGYIALEGSLRQDDHILKINGADVSNANHDAVVEALGAATRKDKFTITVWRKLPIETVPISKEITVANNTTSGFIVFTALSHVITLTNKAGQDLGVALEADGPNVFVRNITDPTGSCVAAGIEHGDEIVEVNGVHCSGMSGDAVTKLLQIVDTPISVHVRHRDAPPGVFVLAVEPDSAAYLVGDLQPGDRIVTVDDVAVDDDDASSVQKLLDTAGRHRVTVHRSVDAKPEAGILRRLTITKDADGKPLGLNFIHEEDEKSFGFIIVGVTTGSPAHAAKVFEGDEIVVVNGIAVKGKSRDECAALFSDAPSSFAVVVQQKRGFDARVLVGSRTVDLIGDPKMPNFGLLIRWDLAATSYRIASIYPDSPAAKVGSVFQVGDRVNAINGNVLKSPQPGVPSPFGIVHENLYPDNLAPGFGERTLTVTKLADALFGFLVASDTGIHVVCEVDVNSAAANAGLFLQDRILDINGTSVAGVAEAEVVKILKAATTTVTLTVARPLTLNVKTITGKVNPVNVLPTDTIGSIKHRINRYAEESLTSLDLQLVFAGDVLADEVCVEDVYGLTEGSVLHLTLSSVTLVVTNDTAPLVLGYELEESLIHCKTCVLHRQPIQGFGLGLGQHEGAGFVTISEVVHNVLRVGDAVLSINKQFVLGASLAEVLAKVRAAGQLLEVQAIPPSELSGMRLVTMVKDHEDEPLGFDIVSNSSGQHRVTNVMPNSLASHYDIPYGDRILSINGIDAALLLHDELLSIMKTYTVLTLLLRTDTSDLPHHHDKLRQALASFAVDPRWDCKSLPGGLSVYKESGALGVRIYAISDDVVQANPNRRASAKLASHDVILDIDGEDVSGWSARKVHERLLQAPCDLTVVSSEVFDKSMANGRVIECTRGSNDRWGFVFISKPEIAFMSGHGEHFTGFTGGVRISDTANSASALKVNDDIVWMETPQGVRTWTMDMTHADIVALFSSEKKLTMFVRDNDQPVEVNEDIITGQQRTVTIKSGERGFGLAIGELNTDGAFVSSLTPGLPADLSNQIFVNDLVIRIDGHTLVGKTHEQVVGLIQGKSEVELVLEASQLQFPPAEEISVTIKKQGGALGMKLYLDQFIIKCMEDLPAANTGKILPWDKIVRVNDDDVDCNAQQFLQGAPEEFELVVQRARVISLPKQSVVADMSFTGDDSTKGVRVAFVTSNSPADQSGVVSGDIVLEVNGTAADQLSVATIETILSEHNANDSITLTLQNCETEESEALMTTSFMQPKLTVSAPVDDSFA